MFQVIYQTQKIMFDQFPNTEKNFENTMRSGVFFFEFKGVWKCAGEIRSSV